MEYNLPCRSEEEELEECVQYLLHHLIVLLLGSEQVLQELDQVGLRNDGCNLIIPANGAYKHDTLQQDIILSILIDQMIVNVLNEVELVDLFSPQISWNVDHGSQKFQQ